MLLEQFQKTYLDNEWIGPWEMDDGRLKIAKTIKKYSKAKNKSYYSITYMYFHLYKCIYCKETAIAGAVAHKGKGAQVIKSTRKDGSPGYTPVTCSRYSECFSKHARIMISKNNIIHDRNNPAICNNGYPYFRVTRTDKDGNKISRGDGNGNRRKMVMMHRLIMEEHLGRKLISNPYRGKYSGELVHHIDCDKMNYNIDNLWLCNDEQHGIAHASTDDLLSTLIHNFDTVKAVKFNRETGKYYLITNEKENAHEL